MPENLNILKDALNTNAVPFSLGSLVLNLIIGAIISFFLKFHYKKFSSTLNNREEFGNIFPFILYKSIRQNSNFLHSILEIYIIF